MIIGLKQRTIIFFVREKVYSGTTVSHMVANSIKPGESTVFLRNEFTQSNSGSSSSSSGGGGSSTACCCCMDVPQQETEMDTLY